MLKEDTHTSTFMDKTLDNPALNDLSMFKHLCIYLCCMQQQYYICIAAFCYFSVYFAVCPVLQIGKLIWHGDLAPAFYESKEEF